MFVAATHFSYNEVLSVVEDWVRQARAKSTSLLNISGIITHLVLILASVIALHEGY